MTPKAPSRSTTASAFEDEHPLLFPLPARPPLAPLAGMTGSTPKPARGQALMEMMLERWNAFKAWSGFTKREIQVEIVPGRKCWVTIPQEAPPKMIVFRLFPDKKNGGFFTRPLTLWGGLVRINDTLCADLGLPIGRTTLWRLVYAGFLDAFRVAPMTTLLDLDSVRQHLLATKIDANAPPYWTAERLTRYREWEKITPELLAKMQADAEDDDEDE